jgi:hypothetical protein
MRVASKSAALFILLAGSSVSAQTAVMPPHASNFTGNTRGYYFTAPVGFRITGVQVLQATGSNAFQNWAVVRFDNNTPPPLFSATTNAFQQIGLGLNEPANTYTPVSIVVQPGDVIGIYGNTAVAAGTTSGTNSYTGTASAATTEILGNNVTLFRSGMQFHLGSATSPQGMHDIWAEASNAISRVEFTYAPLDPNATGACCFTDGTCQFITHAACDAASGTFRGENVTCAAANCPQPGACCFNDGTCTFILQSACTAAGGNWTSAGVTCATANCPQPAACCFFDGTCAMLTSTACLAQAGSPQAAGSTCGTITCPGIPPVVYSNCNLTTGNTTLNGFPAPSGSLWSEAGHAEGDPTIANDIAGFGGTGALRLADDFTVGAGGLNLAYVKIPSYSTGALGLTLNAATLRIWDGRPDDPTSQVVFGDTTTNRLAHAELSNVYRVWNTVTGQTCGGAPIAPGTTRRLQWGYIAVNQNLPQGTYWLDWNFTGTSFAPGATRANAMSRQCDPNNANAMQFNLAWGPLIDNGYGCGAPVPLAQDMYFELLGTPGSTCYANCDQSTVAPILNVDDFTCFINSYASAQSLPPAQQLTHYSNCDGSTVHPVLNVDDFTCFINQYAQGCP